MKPTRGRCVGALLACVRAHVEQGCRKPPAGVNDGPSDCSIEAATIANARSRPRAVAATASRRGHVSARARARAQLVCVRIFPRVFSRVLFLTFRASFF
eukprot:6186017-Pleurochrysis_carterae.AAC.1